ncbi:MAG: FosX/FosE/FosI family fosfomycin resistance thiol transferase [Spirochaetes bacterium RBG_13_51_14]|nr:MAG: FosX/FosE/FosI family fosfomycin resistance thiol transferase [Spirochaetes bacterium RBG_13_51_14]
MINGLSHITLVVHDIHKTTELFNFLFDAKEIYYSADTYYSLSKEKFLLVNDLWIAIMEGDPLPVKTYNHIAFKISEGDFDMYLDKITKLGLEIIDDRSRLPGEGKSIYFFDYDNHLFELHTGSLEERLREYQKE